MSNHTQTPWHIESVATGAYKSVVSLVSAADGKITKICCNDADAAFIVRAVNAHKALVDALKVAQCEIDQRGTVDREMVQARISEALKLASGEE